jgi:hypothetical protein
MQKPKLTYTPFEVKKSWDFSVLIDPIEKIEQRVKKIEELSVLLQSVPKTVFYFESDALLMKQQHIAKIKKEFSESLKIGFHNLAKDLDTLTQFNIVHWDLCPKNILFDGTQCWLIDWEPSFFQLRNNRKCKMITPPYFAPEQINNTELTQLSDKVSFVMSFIKISGNRRMEVQEILNCQELARKLNFEELFDYYFAETNRLQKSNQFETYIKI